MEGKSVRLVVVMLIVLMGMFVGQSSASLKKCYNDCLLLCIIQHPGPDAAVICPFKCTKQCILKESSSNDHLHNYCQIGCASSTCTNISTSQNPREEEVQGCLNSCSNKCAKQY